MSKSNSCRALSVWPALGVGLIAAVAPADTAVADDTAEFEEVLVTARLKEESLGDVPISISVISAETLADASVIDVQDLALLTPGLVSSSAFGRINASPSIRGLVNAGLGEEQTVAFFVDGIYISGRTGLNASYFGLERVEVSKGPQSALYGRNAFVGAVNYVTKRPTETFEGSVSATVGSNDLVRGLIEMSGPLDGDRLMGRVGFYTSENSGDFANNVPGGIDVGSIETTAAMASLLFRPSGNSEFYVNLSYADETDGAPPHYLVPANVLPAPGSGFPRYFEGEFPANEVGFFTNAEHQGTERETLRFTLNADIDLNDSLTLQGLTGYNAQEGFYDFDADYTELFFNRTFEEFDKSDFSQEIRLSNLVSGEPVQWLIGASYYSFDDELLARNYLPGFGQTLPDGTLNESTTDSIGVYGSVTVPLGERVTVTAELRYNDEEKTLERPGFDLSADWQEFLPRLTVSYAPGDRTLVYGSVARGFKTGGFNTFDNLFPEERVYEPESNWTYELGLKGSLADGRFTYGTALYFIDVEDQQVIGLSEAGASSNQFTANAAESSSRGVELEANWFVSDALSLTAGYAWTDAEFDDFVDPDLVPLPIDADVSGNRINRTSEHQLNLTALFETALTSRLDWFARLDYAWQSSQFSVPANLAETGDVTNVNARLGLRAERFAVSLWGRNVTDDDTPYVGARWFDATGTYTGLPPFQRAWLVTAREGAVFGLTLDWNFGD